jgi:hypothetical protein
VHVFAPAKAPFCLYCVCADADFILIVLHLPQVALGQDNHGLNTTRSLLLLVPNQLPLVSPAGNTSAPPQGQLLGNKVLFVGTSPASSLAFGYQRDGLVLPEGAMQSHANFRDIRLTQLPQGPSGGLPSSSSGSGSGQQPPGESQWPAAGPLPQSAAAAAAAAQRLRPPRRLLQQTAAQESSASLPAVEQFALLLWCVERWVGARGGRCCARHHAGARGVHRGGLAVFVGWLCDLCDMVVCGSCYAMPMGL